MSRLGPCRTRHAFCANARLDEPGGASVKLFAEQFAASKAPKATKVTLVLSFDTYLVQDGKSDYHVSWTATTEYDVKAKTSGAIAYATGAAGAVAGLPKDLKKLLATHQGGSHDETQKDQEPRSTNRGRWGDVDVVNGRI